MDKELLNICYKKHNKETILSWDEIAKMYGYVNGESLRCKFKKYRKSIGDLKSQEFVRDISPTLSQNYKSSTELKSDGSQTSDKLISMSENESKDIDFILKNHGYSPSEFELVSAKNSMWNMNTKEDGIKILYSSRIAVKPRTQYLWNEEDAKKIFANLKTSNKRKSIIPMQYKQNGEILIVALADFHYNLL